jgi:hypothetical protein
VALLTLWPHKFISILKTHTQIRLTLKRLTFFHWQSFCINSFTMNILLTTKNDMSRLWAELTFRITKTFSKKFVRNYKLISPGSRKLLIRGLWIKKIDLHGKDLWKFTIIDPKIKSNQSLYLKSQLLNRFYNMKTQISSKLQTQRTTKWKPNRVKSNKRLRKSKICKKSSIKY